MLSLYQDNIFEIFLYLDVIDIINLALTCKNFYESIKKNQIWIYLVDEITKKDRVNYKKVFKQECFDTFKTHKKLLILIEKLIKPYNKKIDRLKKTHGFTIKNNCPLMSDKKIPEDIVTLFVLNELLLPFNVNKIPYGLNQLIFLEKLDLKKNKLKEIPPQIFQLVNLKELYLSYNYLKKINLKIGVLVKLKILYLNNNKIQEIPEEVGNLINLEKLNLQNNCLKELSTALTRLTNLKDLFFWNNHGFQIPVPNELKSNPNLNIIY